MIVSNRAQKAPQSPIRKLVSFANETKKRGIEVYHLNIGQPDFEIPDLISQELKKRAGSKTLAYAASDGVFETRQAWSKYYHDAHLEITPEEVIITTGGTEAIMLALWTGLDENDELLVFEPGYANYAGYAIQTGVRLIPVLTSPENGFHLPEKSEIEKAVSPRIKAILVTSPNNPTGTVLTTAEITLLINLAAKHDLMIIADETYRGIVFDHRENKSFLEIGMELGEARRIIIVDSLSKRLNVCGARLGAFATKNVDFLRAANKLAQNRLCVATLEQEIVTPMLNNCLVYIQGIAKEYQRRRDALYRLLSAESDIQLAQPEGAFYMLPSLPITDGEDFARWLLTDFSENGKTVMVAPGAGFYFTPGLGNSQVRIAYVLEEEKLTEATHIFLKGLRKYQKRKT